MLFGLYKSKLLDYLFLHLYMGPFFQMNKNQEVPYACIYNVLLATKKNDKKRMNQKDRENGSGNCCRDSFCFVSPFAQPRSGALMFRRLAMYLRRLWNWLP